VKDWRASERRQSLMYASTWKNGTITLSRGFTPSSSW
jgi:hypothetical protein